ncbi:hypothetical protein [Xanthomonas hortorum]|nr:hypothetical protein [Xanthomonas hortorum]MCC8514028.1 hypothetical protein [Xanthomonas hortorum pv. gardneri]MCC8654782.1 hypothetical protein [Xanthomonas hortorum pv. gardneri]MCC8659090.1 hypothetical protein [Xanthomonas hortorum pv. gardneri]MCC8663354.1 hypothetical protein [Xanthomonas hortorum pv. gardneri]MCC8667694.1 hypothetical protein [Xanthomonas hortorum pv. gardneri]
MWRIFNVLTVTVGAAFVSPFVLIGLGTYESPPTILFSAVIFLFSLGGGIFLAYYDANIQGNKWLEPSLSISPFGAGKKLQNLYLTSFTLVSLGVFCMFFGRYPDGIEWIGALPLLIGMGLAVASILARVYFKDNFICSQ